MLVRDAKAGNVIEILDGGAGVQYASGRIYLIDSAASDHKNPVARARRTGRITQLYPDAACRLVTDAYDDGNWSFGHD